MTREEVLIARGTADAFALRHKFHDAKCPARYMPLGQMAQDLYTAMEQRGSKKSVRHMPGTAGNIDARSVMRRSARADQIRDATETPWPQPRAI
jgi:cobaltochelatase CobT